MNYHKDFKNERFHDRNLIKLAEILHSRGQNQILERFLGVQINSLGNFQGGHTKQHFDVLLEYENYNIVVETKVDSAESPKQTDRIFKKYSNKWNKEVIFLYITYGTAEYHIHLNELGDFSHGPFSKHFHHIGCKVIKNLVVNAITACGITDERILTWRQWLEFEIQKRYDRDAYLKDLNSILTRYKGFLDLTDYPVNRLTLFAPEFTMPFYSDLGQAWNERKHPIIGRTTLGPLGRIYSTVGDSILNFNELWHSTVHTMTCNGLVEPGNLYFEFNEDFNLHLKCSPRVSNIEEIRAYVSCYLEDLKRGFNGTVEYHKQGTYAVFEWDLELLSNDLEHNLNSIEGVITNTLTVLE